MNTKCLEILESLPCKDDITKLVITQKSIYFTLPHILCELAFDILEDINKKVDRSKDVFTFSFKDGYLSVTVFFNENK